MSNLISFEDEKAEERNSLGIVLTVKMYRNVPIHTGMYVNYS